MTSDGNTTTDSRRVEPAGVVYVIFEENPIGWREVGKRTARDAKTAIRETVKTLATDDQDNTFAAVPERSWTKLRIRPRVVTEYDVEEVS